MVYKNLLHTHSTYADTYDVNVICVLCCFAVGILSWLMCYQMDEFERLNTSGHAFACRVSSACPPGSKFEHTGSASSESYRLGFIARSQLENLREKEIDK